MIKKRLLFSIVALGLAIGCSTVPITNRKRINIVSDEEVLPMSFKQYDEFLASNKKSKDAAKTNEIKEVGKRISKAVDKFMRANGMSKEADSYKWEFNLIEDETINAWCMPGGKVVFYTGILPIAKNTDGIAAIMGHEVAHAFAKHGQERMTTGQLQQYGGTAVALATSGQTEKSQQIWNMAYGVGSNLGVLKYSRVHEDEADKLGMVFMIMAGYEPEEAVQVWVRMKEKTGGSSTPEFMSTHPSNDSRIKALKAYLPEAKRLANQYK
ncbi:M48 family metallopeptidase [Aureivirga marina]|uniref:M48 family metallopeptidase n=1 Tax=Aureivirga marina TaxID=1182451 RepID=UPI0018CABAF7|nr:M48 family metallopeptidase [Aureivirga marina]